MWEFSDSPSRFHFSTLPPMRARTLFISLCPGCPAQDSALKPGLGKCFHIRGLPCRQVSSAQGTASGGGLYQSHPVSEGSGVKGGRPCRHPARRPFCQPWALLADIRDPESLPGESLQRDLVEASVRWALAMWLPVRQGPRVVRGRNTRYMICCEAKTSQYIRHSEPAITYPSSKLCKRG